MDIFHRYVFLGKLSVKVLAHILNQVVCFLTVELQEPLCILDNGPLSDVFFANIFSQLASCHSCFLGSVFCRAEIVNEVQFTSYFFLGLCLWLYQKSHCQSQGYIDFLLCYLLGGL